VGNPGQFMDQESPYFPSEADIAAMIRVGVNYSPAFAAQGKGVRLVPFQWQDGNLNAPMRVLQMSTSVPMYSCVYQKVHSFAGSTLIEL
jgi:hypothetical protein